MPIKIGKKVFADFDDAVDYIRRIKKLPKDRAEAYVATIERAQRKGAKHK